MYNFRAVQIPILAVSHYCGCHVFNKLYHKNSKRVKINQRWLFTGLQTKPEMEFKF